MRLTGESARAKELYEEGEFILAKTDLTMAATPKQLYDRWQRAVKKGYKQKINIDEYWEGLIIGTAIDLKEKIKKTSSIDKRNRLVARWREDFDAYLLRSDCSLKIQQLLENKTSELKDIAKINYIAIEEIQSNRLQEKQNVFIR